MKVCKKLNYALTSSEGKYVFARDKDLIKEYVIFDDYKLYFDLPKKHYYEIIEDTQKIYFDIDIKAEEVEEKDVKDFISSFKDHLIKMYGDKINIYSSNIKTKYSYHILIYNVAVRDNTQCRARVEEILKSFDHPFKKYIDMKIYRKHQLLRLLGSSKTGKDNTKIVYDCYKDDFLSSLVCNIDKDTIILDDLDVEYKILPIRLQMKKYKK